MANSENTGTTVHCARCGRVLSDPRSISRGVGPVCAKRIALAQALRPVLTRFAPKTVARALELIADGGLLPVRTGLYLAVSSDGTTRYETAPGSCTCAAGTFGRLCYHRVAAALVAA